MPVVGKRNEQTYLLSSTDPETSEIFFRQALFIGWRGCKRACRRGEFPTWYTQSFEANSIWLPETGGRIPCQFAAHGWPPMGLRAHATPYAGLGPDSEHEAIQHEAWLENMADLEAKGTGPFAKTPSSTPRRRQ
jgi:hypothetical protein